ncbi:MAG: ABC transporter ATP-binding protein [candidate division Zixibacteria bacterium]|nr:ABC transporter ATP-binding protein [candidate division Zixibacteria bacterium]
MTTAAPQSPKRLNSLRRFLSYVHPYRIHLVVSVTATVFYVALSALLFLLIGPLVKTLFLHSPIDPTATPDTIASTGMGAWVDRLKNGAVRLFSELIIRPKESVTLARMCIAVLLISLAKNILLYLQNIVVAVVQQRLIRTIRLELFSHYHDLSLAYFASTRTGQIISRVTNDVRVLNDMLDLGFTRLVKEPLTVIVLLAMLFIISWQLALVTVVVLPLSATVMIVVGRFVRRYSRRSQERIADLHSIVEESVGGIRVVKAFGMQRFEIERFHDSNEAFYRATLKMARVRILNSPVNEILGTAAGVTILWFGGNAVLTRNGLSPEAFINFILIVFAMIQPVKALAEILAKIQEGRAAADRVFEALDTPVDIADLPGARPMTTFRDKITYEDLSFRYETGPWVLRHINLTIPRGQSVALVGPSGGGKSTLCDLLARFYDPSEGRVAIDGADLRELTMNSIRAHLGVVTQDIVLFNDTVAHNIAYGLPDINTERLRRAAETANALEFIEQLPRGFDTVVGTRGVKLSGGQRQRIAIARAILRDPPILIFDEATSALDTESETAVRLAIANLLQDRTALIVAHRLSTVRNADKIVVVDNGQIVDSGSHDELLGRGGLYRRLYDLQFAETRLVSVE